jgi:ABC-type transport system involved in multi-copper enzyme maturation permease subunit
MIVDARFFPIWKSEILKFILLKVHTRVFFLNSVILFLMIGTYLKFSTQSGVDYSMEVHTGILKAHLFYTRFIYLFILSTTICTNFGKEFEWRTIHQFLIKGLTSKNMILTKFFAYWILFVVEYFLYTSLILIGYFLFSPVSFAESIAVVSWMEILSAPVGIGMAVGISILAVSITFSSSQAMIFNFLYFIIVEMVFRGILSLVNMISKSPVLTTILEYFPYQSYLAIQSETPDVVFYFFTSIAYTIGSVALSYAFLRRKEFALVNT